jgi:hypothetical protein
MLQKRSLSEDSDTFHQYVQTLLSVRSSAVRAGGFGCGQDLNASKEQAHDGATREDR